MSPTLFLIHILSYRLKVIPGILSGIYLEWSFFLALEWHMELPILPSPAELVPISETAMSSTDQCPEPVLIP
jgi:hypothetical protein